MSVTFAPAPWPAPAAASASAWVFAREVQLPGVASPVLQWVLRRHCAIAPRQLLAVYLSLCVLALAVAGAFWLRGAPAILGFALLELLALGLALLVYGRHAADREVLTLQGRQLHVEQTLGAAQVSQTFQADWLHVEPVAGQGSLLALSSRGQAMQVGRFLRPEVRAAFAQELRRALRRAGAAEHQTGSELK
jgi:uncharacterized membrane protein